MAAETETLTITLSADIVQSIRDRVAAGDFASESDVIAAQFQQTDKYAWLPDEPFDGMSEDEWDQEIRARHAELLAGKATLYTLDEVKQQLAELSAEQAA